MPCAFADLDLHYRPAYLSNCPKRGYRSKPTIGCYAVKALYPVSVVLSPSISFENCILLKKSCRMLAKVCLRSSVLPPLEKKRRFFSTPLVKGTSYCGVPQGPILRHMFFLTVVKYTIKRLVMINIFIYAFISLFGWYSLSAKTWNTWISNNGYDRAEGSPLCSCKIRSSDNDSIGFWPPGSLHTLGADGHI